MGALRLKKYTIKEAQELLATGFVLKGQDGFVDRRSSPYPQSRYTDDVEYARIYSAFQAKHPSTRRFNDEHFVKLSDVAGIRFLSDEICEIVPKKRAHKSYDDFLALSYWSKLDSVNDLKQELKELDREIKRLAKKVPPKARRRRPTPLWKRK